jgi:hypothetical protein
MSEDQTSGRFSLWTVLVVAATVASAAAGAAWQVGRSRLQDELDQYKQSSTWGLPETLQRLNKVSQQLNLTLDEREQLVKAQHLLAENEELNRQLSAAKNELVTVNKRLAEFEGDTFEVAEGTSHPIVPGRLALGVKDTYSNNCSVQLGDQSTTASPGTPIDATLGKMKYRVILMEVKGSVCKFSLSHEASK